MKKTMGLLCLLIILIAGRSYGDTAIKNVTEASDIEHFLRKGYSISLSSLSNVKILYRGRYWQDPDWSKSLGFLNQEETFTSHEYIRQGENERLVFLGVSDTPQEDSIFGKVEFIGTKSSPSYAVFSEHTILDYYNTEGTEDTETQKGRATIELSNSSLLNSSNFSPIKFFGYKDDFMPDDVMSSNKLNIATKPEEINGLLSYKVSGIIGIKNKYFYNVTYWLAPERSCMPVKMELRDTDGTLKKTMSYSNFIELENGVWVPKEVVQEVYSENHQNNEPRVVNIDKYTIEKVELNPDIDEDTIFNTQPDSLPKGTLLYDAIAGLNYTVGEGPVSDEAIQRILSETLNELGSTPEADIKSDGSLSPKIIISESKEESNIESPRPLLDEDGIMSSLPIADSKADQGTSSFKIYIIISSGLFAIIVIITSIVKKRIKNGNDESTH